MHKSLVCKFGLRPKVREREREKEKELACKSARAEFKKSEPKVYLQFGGKTDRLAFGWRCLWKYFHRPYSHVFRRWRLFSSVAALLWFRKDKHDSEQQIANQMLSKTIGTDSSDEGVRGRINEIAFPSICISNKRIEQISGLGKKQKAGILQHLLSHNPLWHVTAFRE
jgi:hypothetical protein